MGIKNIHTSLNENREKLASYSKGPLKMLYGEVACFPVIRRGVFGSYAYFIIVSYYRRQACFRMILILNDTNAKIIPYILCLM